MTTLLKEKKATIRILVCSNENYPAVKAIARREDMVQPVASPSITLDLVRKLKLNLQSDGIVTNAFPAKDEIPYLMVDVPASRLREAIETINTIFQDGLVLRSRM